eukprot:156536_1
MHSKELPYPSIIETNHPIPNFHSCISLTIPQTYSSQIISKFSCIPYFIYNNYRDHPHTQILSNFFGFICVPLSTFISQISQNNKMKSSESIIIRHLLCYKLVFLKCHLPINKSNYNKKSKVIKDIYFKLMHFTFPLQNKSNKSEEILYHTINVWIAFFLNIFPNNYLY